MINGQTVQSPTMAEVLEIFRTRIMQELHVAKVGVIQSFNLTQRTAEIQIVFDIELHDGTIKSYPILVDCPVVTISGGGGSLTFPITKGDECLVIFSDSNIDGWFEQGKNCVPYDDRKHDLSDGIAIVGINAIPNNNISQSASEVALQYGGAKIAEKNGKIMVGNATQNLLTSLTAMITALNADPAISGSTKTALGVVQTQLNALLY